MSYDLFSGSEQNKLDLGMTGVNYQVDRNFLSTTQDKVRKLAEDSLQFFGTRGAAGLDSTIESILPKPEDFVGVPFRQLSSTIVAPNTWRATDFSKGNILRNSTQRLNNKPVYINHDTYTVNSWVGLVTEPKWSKASEQNGVKVPSGIDAMILIDAKSNPKILRGVMSGGIFSMSVTVVFDWKPSHQFDNERDFINSIGNKAEDGSMFRRIVTTIHDYYESSLVWLGADPFAKLIGEDGNLVHVDHAQAAQSSFEKETEKVKRGYDVGKNYYVGCAIDRNILSLAKSNYICDDFTDKHNVNQIIPNMNQETFLALLTLLGLPTDTKQEALTTEQLTSLKLVDKAVETEITEKVEMFGKVADSFKALDETLELSEDNLNKVILLKVEEHATLVANAAKVPTLVTEKNILVAEKEALAKEAQVGKAFIAAKRVEAIRLYKAKNMENVDEAVIGLFNKANSEELDGLIKNYTEGVTLAFSGKCKDCGSTEFTFQNSVNSLAANAEEDNDEGFDFETYRDAKLAKATGF